MHPLCSEIIHILSGILPEQRPLPLHEPFFNGNESKYIQDCLKTRFVSSIGRYVSEFEQQLAAYTGAGDAVAVVNGTSALHIALHMAGAGTGDEVLLPALTFVATANAVSYCGATPHFIDSAPDGPNLDPEKLERYLDTHTKVKNGVCFNTKTEKPIRALVPVHIFGNPAPMTQVMEISRRFHLKVVEDAAESLGSFYNHQHTGTFGFAGILSFNGNKILTTGGGGAILFNDRKTAERARHLTTTAKITHPYRFTHDMTGYNYRMPNINAAMGCAQLEQLPGFLKSKQAVAEAYRNAFLPVKGVDMLSTPGNCRSNHWLNALLLSRPDRHLQNCILKETNTAGIHTRPVWTPLHHLPMYRLCPAMDLSNTDALSHRLINLPSSINLETRDNAS